ncbi:hypothetical protein CBOM_08138 [Ceraceosorus bombacis]|uniref:Uncharacterized protein n=1 Tax=Ceraceosorus bombacis TaxID=401625 RepID=A0A0P1B8C5_9BASI|nr:hypothetical protein CBOM_08138 [Ceraceosorus bombacis]
MASGSQRQAESKHGLKQPSKSNLGPALFQSIKLGIRQSEALKEFHLQLGPLGLALALLLTFYTCAIPLYNEWLYFSGRRSGKGVDVPVGWAGARLRS